MEQHQGGGLTAPPYTSKGTKIMNTQSFDNGLTNAQADEIDDITMSIVSRALRIEDLGRHRSYSAAITKLDEAKHWLQDRKYRAE